MVEQQQSQSFSVRHFQPQDYDHLIQLWQKAGLARPERKDDLQTILRTIQKGGALFVLINNKNQQIVGSSWITNDGRRLHLQYFAIAPEYQGQKLSHLLMQHSLDFAKKLKMQIKLEVHHTNLRAISLYKKWGFKVLDGYLIMIRRKTE